MIEIWGYNGVNIQDKPKKHFKDVVKNNVGVLSEDWEQMTEN